MPHPLHAPSRKVAVTPVIHVQSVAQAMRNAELAFDCGVDGVWLIHMDGFDDELEDVAVHLKVRWPNRWIGVNYLSRGPLHSLTRNLQLEMDATWTDSPGVSSEYVSDEARHVGELIKQNPNHAFFGSVAFKYQTVDTDPGESAYRALQLGMIPTTSGDATGVAAEMTKLQAIQLRCPAAPLALASGLTPENALRYAPYVSHMLVATGVSRSFYEFDEQKMRAFVDAVTIKKPVY